MKPIKLVLSAWGPYSSKEIVDFSQFKEDSLFLVTGPTGGGKTTIFDGITYALYGNASGNNRDKTTFRSDFAKQETDTFVEFWFSHRGSIYKVKRSPRYSRPKKRGTGETLSAETAELFEEGKEPCTAINEVNKRLERILGINYRQFKQVAMIAQGEFLELLLANSKDRVEIFRNIFQTGEYEHIQRKISDYAKAVYSKLLKQKNKMEEAVSIIQTEKAELNELRKAEFLPFDKIASLLTQLLEEEKEEIEILEKEVSKLEKQIKKLVSKGEVYFTIQKQLDEAKKKLCAFEQELKTGEEEKAKLERIFHDFINQQEKEENNIAAEKDKLEAEKEVNEQEHKRLEQIELELEKQRGRLAKKKENIKVIDDIKNKLKMEAEQEQILISLQTDYEGKNKTAHQLKHDYEKKEELYKASVIGLTAKYLEDGKPCPVCGSLEHPNIAKICGEIPDEKEIKQAKRKWEQQEKLKNSSYQMAAEQNGKLQAIHKEVQEKLKENDLMGEQVEEHYKILIKEEKGEKEKCKALEKEEIRKKKLEKEIEILQNKIISLEKTGEKKRAEFQKKQENFKKELEKKLIFIESHKAVIEESKKQLKKLKKEEEIYIKKLEHELEGVKVDLLKEQIASLENEKKVLLKKKEKKKQIFQMNRTVMDSITEKNKEKEQLEQEYGIIKDLDRVTKGNNKDRIIFEHYVLAFYFETIIQAANIRLIKMTAGRYTLSKVEQVSDARTTDSLNLEVFDSFTGKKRPIKTLSGGESFKAALALALGLSDVVKRYAGGIQIETLFIDEGFGSLDEESLEQALDTLGSLTENNCLIGIISHVNELKERISQKIVVKRGNYGSYIEKQNEY